MSPRRGTRWRRGNYAAACFAIATWATATGATSATGAVLDQQESTGPSVTVTIPSDCQGSNCPTVIASPASNLGDDQAVSLSLSNFKKDQSIVLYYCADTSATLPQACMSDNTYPSTGFFARESIVTGAGGTASASMVVQSADPLSGDTPFPAEDVWNSSQPPFYCSTSGNPCALEVVEGTVATTPAANNTAVIPVTFRPSTPAGCSPLTQPVATESAWTMQRLIPIVNEVTCAGSPALLDFDTSVQSNAIGSDLMAGNAQIGFTDDPQDPATQQALHSGKFALIPVALSATVDAFTFSVTNRNVPGGVDIPVTSLNLTPNLVAGLLTGAYASANGIVSGNPPQVSDEVPASLYPGVCAAGFTCPLLVALNPTPTNVQLYNVQVASEPYAASSGTAREALTWLCDTPNVAMTVAGSSYVDPHVPSVTLTDPGVGWSGHAAWPISGCNLADTIPPLTNQGIPTNIDPVGRTSPADQASHVTSYGYQALGQSGASAVPYGAVAVMDSSQAQYFGLGAAALQNAAGEFVAPSATTVAAAMADATTNPDGTLTTAFDPVAPDAGAYPMPMVTYALVPTTPQAPGIAAAMARLLLDLLSITGGSTATNAADLPPGYFPLPSSVASQAVTDVATDIRTQSPTAPSGPATDSSTTTTAIPNGAAVNQPPVASLAPVAAAAGADTSGGPGTPGREAGPGRPSAGPDGLIGAPSTPTSRQPPRVELTSPRRPSAAAFVFGGSRLGWVLLSLFCVGAAALVAGPLLMLSGRRLRLPGGFLSRPGRPRAGRP